MRDDRPHVCVPPGDETWLHLHLEDPDGARRYVLCAAWRGDERCRCGMYTLLWEEEDDGSEEE